MRGSVFRPDRTRAAVFYENHVPLESDQRFKSPTFDILKFSPKQKAPARGSGEYIHTNPCIYSLEPRDDAFCVGLNFNWLVLGLFKW